MQMDCNECNKLIGAFIDNELDESQAADVCAHLAACSECADACEALSAMLEECKTVEPTEVMPPNSKALWCRINNVIESDLKRDEPAAASEPKRRFWQLTFGQVAAALLCVAVISSLLTVAAIRNYTQPATADFTTRSAVSQSVFERVLSKVGLVETPQQARERRLKEQHAAIEYWDARVQARRAQWDRTTRDAFDRNLQVINESVNEYTVTLQQDPDDELSGEMLDSVLNDKMNLLRDFSDL
jgi:hypothetical protein